MTPLTNEQYEEWLKFYAWSMGADKTTRAKAIADYWLSQITALKEQIRQQITDKKEVLKLSAGLPL